MQYPAKREPVKRKAQVKTTLKAQLNGELDLTKDEIITVLEVIEDGRCFGITKDNRKGTFPESFVTYIKDINVDEADRTLASTKDSFPRLVQKTCHAKKKLEDSSNTSYSADKLGSNYYHSYPESLSNVIPTFSESKLENSQYKENLNVLGVEPYAITLYPFSAQFPNELSFRVGEVVHLIKHVDSEWAEGSIESVKGIFPVSYVKIIIGYNHENKKNVMVEEKSDNFANQDNFFQSEMLARVGYTFKARMNGDLSVREGDIITIVEVVNKDWVIVKNKKGEIGSCPSSYISSSLETLTGIPDDILEDFVNAEHNEDANETATESCGVTKLSQPNRSAPPAPTLETVPCRRQCSISDDVKVLNRSKSDTQQNVLLELILTEKEYVRDLKVTCETFDLYNPSFLEGRGIDVSTLFGNIKQIKTVADKFLELLLKSMKGCEENVEIVGSCFLEMAEEMKRAYVKYCTNYESALFLLHQVSTLSVLKHSTSSIISFEKLRSYWLQIYRNTLESR